jgi:hypothetical protein
MTDEEPLQGLPVAGARPGHQLLIGGLGHNRGQRVAHRVRQYSPGTGTVKMGLHGP